MSSLLILDGGAKTTKKFAVCRLPSVLVHNSSFHLLRRTQVAHIGKLDLSSPADSRMHSLKIFTSNHDPKTIPRMNFRIRWHCGALSKDNSQQMKRETGSVKRQGGMKSGRVLQ